ncbi:hypothetical protein GCM10022223_65770 [Kineosporia mesophila]|uniref:Secreted protein n=1 Tax=Kineosporia mesophila TaxID=566012 RepID=A0ABP7AQR6_9ACTN|nr:DUF6167 family protein [Kineosporia mesophila]MCD5349173.1 DUF6167 family protein [Kineosporia mesophila]
MARLFWIAVGAGAGVYVVHKFTKTVEQYTPAGLSSSLSSVGDGLREMAEVIREGMAEREQELRIALGVDAGTLDPQAAQSLMQDPTGPRRYDDPDSPENDPRYY